MLAACGPTDQERAAAKERRRIDCLESICPGDVLPKYDTLRYELIKLDGRWFIGPKSYFSSGISGASFYWPSGRPLRAEPTEAWRDPASDKPSNEDVINIYLRSHAFPEGPTGYALVELAEKNGWIAKRTTLRPGLDQIRMKHVIGPGPNYLDYMTYYVATELRGQDGLPPVAACNHDDPRNGGGSGFLWREHIWAGVRLNQEHCADWPEIYLATMRVLPLLEEIKR